MPEIFNATKPEAAPSQSLPQEPIFARLLGGIGLGSLLSGFSLVIMTYGFGPRILSIHFGFVAIALGLVLMLLHSLSDRDMQIRRAYIAMGVMFLLMTGIFTIVDHVNFLKYGWASSLLGLFFLLTGSRFEEDRIWRKVVLVLLGVTGSCYTALGFIQGIISSGEFILTYGSLLVILGLCFLSAFIYRCDPQGTTGHRTGLLMAGLAIFIILYVVLRATIPLLTTVDLPPFFMPTGLVLLAHGVVWGAVALGMTSDSRLVVLIQRELLSYFCSPIAYILMAAMACLAGFAYLLFVFTLLNNGAMEPIVRLYLSRLPPFAVIFIVPAITMRLLAEEKRSGTYEVLMTTPLKESTVVLSKFSACLIFFMILWGIWAIFLIPLRAETGVPFDYRPLLTFYLCLLVSGSAMVSLGLFFSSLSPNQIIAAVLTFITLFIMLLLILFVIDLTIGTMWRKVFESLSFYSMWDSALNGRLALRDLFLQASFTILGLFMTTKVLEMRRWL